MQENVTNWPKRQLRIDQSCDGANVILIETSDRSRLLATRVIHYTPTELWECWSYIGYECSDLQTPQSSWLHADGGGKNLKTKYGEVARWGSEHDSITFWH